MPAHARAEEVAGRIAQDEFAFRALSVAANLGERARRSEANVHEPRPAWARFQLTNANGIKREEGEEGEGRRSRGEDRRVFARG